MSQATLVFERNSMLSTTVTRGGSPLYAVSTDKHGLTTEVRAPGTDTLLVRVARRDIFPDTIAFAADANSKPMRLSKWLKRSTLADGFSAATFDTPAGACVLRTHPVYRLAVYTADLTCIIAHWKPDAAMALVLAKGTTLDAASEVRIFAAFLYEEQRMRVADRNGEVAASKGIYSAVYHVDMYPQGG
ncbi:hypothetical protein FB451DRAFT_733105 [Mycena latifolia]|nr:hypothetical protein FB451DRAFT_733105 [Mycena latifolia]